MLRERLHEELKAAMKAKEVRAVSTLRLSLAALKDRDIAARGKGNPDGIDEDEILQMLHTMVKQRREGITLYEKGGREDLAKQESEEIAIIERFLPSQMSDREIARAVAAIIKELKAGSLKDMGPTMAELRKRYAGQMDFAKASQLAKEKLS